MDTIDRILLLMEMANVTAADLSREISLTNGVVTQWKARKSKPSTDAIIKLAKFFNVSTDYLLTGTEKKPSLSQEDSDWLALLHELPPDERQSCFIYMQGFVDGVNKNRNNNYKRQEKAAGE